jgi:NAD(P)H-dependent FMN reductase
MLDVAAEQWTTIADVEVVDSIAIDSLPALDPRRLDDPPQSVDELRRQLANADAVAIAGPEYAGGVAGALKNALDWCVSAPDGFYDRPVAVMSAGTTGGKHAIHQLARTLLWQGAHLIATFGLAAPRTKSDASGRIVEGQARAAIETLADQLSSAVTESASERKSRSHRQALLLAIDDYPHAPA